jgi:hypothetical protein
MYFFSAPLILNIVIVVILAVDSSKGGAKGVTKTVSS